MSSALDTAPVADSVSVVLPAYNEAESITIAVGRALKVLPELAREWEVIVVDDGSTDGTTDVVDDLTRTHYPRVRHLKHDINLGYGAALRTGFSRARYDLIFYTDADNQFDIAELAHALPLMVDHDVLVGFRVYRYDSPLRVFVSWGYNLLIRTLFRVRVRDVDCAFKIFRREVIEKIDIETTNFFVDTELVAKARKWNFRLVEKGVRHYPRMAGETKIEPSDVPRTLRVILRMWQRIHVPTRRQIEAAARARREVMRSDVERIPDQALVEVGPARSARPA
jgi:glycosyltransferase involved in cell wall biosynthesis